MVTVNNKNIWSRSHTNTHTHTCTFIQKKKKKKKTSTPIRYFAKLLISRHFRVCARSRSFRETGIETRWQKRSPALATQETNYPNCTKRKFCVQLVRKCGVAARIYGGKFEKKVTTKKIVRGCANEEKMDDNEAWREMNQRLSLILSCHFYCSKSFIVSSFHQMRINERHLIV